MTCTNLEHGNVAEGGMNGPPGVGVVGGDVDFFDPDHDSVALGSQTISTGHHDDGVVVKLVHLAHEAVSGRKYVSAADYSATAKVLIVYLQGNRVLDLVAVHGRVPASDQRGRFQIAEFDALNWATKNFIEQLKQRASFLRGGCTCGSAI